MRDSLIRFTFALTSTAEAYTPSTNIIVPILVLLVKKKNVA